MADKWIQLMSEDGTDNLFPTGKFDLLWTNSAPTSAFSPQTLSIDFSKYNHILVICKVIANQDMRFANYMIKGQVTTLMSFNQNASGCFQRLECVFTDTQITFGTAYRSGSANNDSTIPLLIYGCN